MFTKKDKNWENIFDFLIQSNRLYLNLINKNEIICEDVIENRIIWNATFNKRQYEISVYKDYLLCSDNNNSSHIYDKFSGELIVSTEKEMFNFRLYTNYSNLVVIEQRKSLLEINQGIYDLENKQVVFFKEGIRPYAVFDNLIIGRTKNTIYKYDNFGNIVWNFALSNLGRWYDDFDRKWIEGEIYHYVGVVDNVLWIDVNGHMIVGIDIQTGELKYNLKEAIAMNVFPDGNQILKPINSRTTYDKNQHKLWGIRMFRYWEVDLHEKSPTLKIWNLEEELKPIQAVFPTFTSCGINDTHVFFGVGSISNIPQVCALNRETLKIDWRYDFSEEAKNREIAFSPTKVAVSENNLFVLDSETTLHIFEKENNCLG